MALFRLFLFAGNPRVDCRKLVTLAAGLLRFDAVAERWKLVLRGSGWLG